VGFFLGKALVELKLVSKPPCDGIGGQKADMVGVAVDGHLGVVEADNVPQHRADRFVRPGYADLPVLKDSEDPRRGHDLVPQPLDVRDDCPSLLGDGAPSVILAMAAEFSSGRGAT